VFTALDKLRCAEREVKLRRQVYPNRIESGRMSPAKAEYEIAVMADIAEDYRKLAEGEMLI
jgi:hypothetical protein